jgi:NADH-quinone oxidoreductase subunit G
VLSHFAGDVMPFEELLRLSSASQFSAVYLVGGDPEGWISEIQAEAFSKIETVIVQDILPSPVLKHATHVLPSGTFVEREGVFVNHKGLAQMIRRSVRGPDGTRPDGRLLVGTCGTNRAHSDRCTAKRDCAAIPALAAINNPELKVNGVLLEEAVVAV